MFATVASSSCSSSSGKPVSSSVIGQKMTINHRAHGDALSAKTSNHIHRFDGTWTSRLALILTQSLHPVALDSFVPTVFRLVIPKRLALNRYCSCTAYSRCSVRQPACSFILPSAGPDPLVWERPVSILHLLDLLKSNLKLIVFYLPQKLLFLEPFDLLDVFLSLNVCSLAC